MIVHNGQPQYVDVCHAIGEGHNVGTTGYAYELHIALLMEKSDEYRKYLDQLLPQDVKPTDLPFVEPKTIQVGFFEDLMKAYADRGRDMEKFLNLLAEAYAAVMGRVRSMVEGVTSLNNFVEPISSPDPQSLSQSQYVNRDEYPLSIC